MDFDFDAMIDRRGTGASKWDRARPRTDGREVIPLWVADMEFAAPPVVQEALARRLAHPVFGYTDAPAAYFEVLANWYQQRYLASVAARDIQLGPGVVPALGIAIRSLTQPGEGVLVMPPVYYPFFSMIRDNHRQVVEAPLKAETPGVLRLDLEAARAALASAARAGIKTTMALFCSPHNPGGRVWDRQELHLVVEFCRIHGLTLVSDEIHGDLVMGSRPFVSLAGFPGADKGVVISAPNKTFNTAGLHLSHFVCPDPSLAAALKTGCLAGGFSQPDILALEAAMAAYRGGWPWLMALKLYLRDNLDLTVARLNRRGLGLQATFPEGGYLVWVEARELMERLGESDTRSLVRRIEDEAAVMLSPGGIFGSGGQTHVRVNVACPQRLLTQALDRLEAWIDSLD